MNKKSNMREVDMGNGWKTHEYVNRKSSGLLRNTKYFYKGIRAPRVLIKNQLTKQLAGYVLIEKDLRNILIWLDQIDKLFVNQNSFVGNSISPNRESFDIIKGLFVAALTFYGKCFTRCSGRKIKLEKNILDDAFFEKHDWIMNARHNFAAHSGADNFEGVQIAVVVPPRRNSDAVPFLSKELMQTDVLLEKESEIKFKEVVEHIQAKVLAKIEFLDKKIMLEDVIPHGREYWVKKYKKRPR